MEALSSEKSEKVDHLGLLRDSLLWVRAARSERHWEFGFLRSYLAESACLVKVMKLLTSGLLLSLG